jgi:hypothetical protein
VRQQFVEVEEQVRPGPKARRDAHVREVAQTVPNALQERHRMARRDGVQRVRETLEVAHAVRTAEVDERLDFALELGMQDPAY